jgi:hypothetical protein
MAPAAAAVATEPFVAAMAVRVGMPVKRCPGQEVRAMC